MAKATLKAGDQAQTTAMDTLQQKIAVIEATKGIIQHLQQYDKDTQEKVLNEAGDILGCWKKRERRTKAQIEAEKANGQAATTEQAAVPV